MKLGILGGGQLAKMLVLCAHTLGIRTVCYSPDPYACVRGVTSLITDAYTDEAALEQFVQDVDCVTFETENIPLTSAEFIAKRVPFFPSIEALKITQDRFLEKSFLNALNIPTARFASIENLVQLQDTFIDWNSAAILKTRRLGYDGKGQYVLHSQSDALESWENKGSNQLIMEQLISFSEELSIIAVRNQHQKTRFYPLIRNQHHKGILQWSEAPFENDELQQKAQNLAMGILNSLEYVGVMTIEFFHHEGELIINEIAPRVHNSGHLTIEGALTSQFENHLRAIFDLPLGDTELKGNCFLVNCLGTMLPIQSCLKIPGAYYHDYSKSSQPSRKVGHVTVVDKNLYRYQSSKHKLLQLLTANNHTQCSTLPPKSI